MGYTLDRSAIAELKSVSKTFPNGVTAVSGIDLDIYEGECLLIAGSNGSGKTVLMRMIAGLTEPSSGEILFRGKAIAALNSRERLQIGLVFQDAGAQIIGETVAEDTAFGPANLKLPKAEQKARVDAALEAAGLSEKRDYPPRSLSGGEKRRLAIAGVLAMGSSLVIMDEPFANLDWPGVVQTLQSIETLKAAGKTTVILTHELEKVLALAGRLVVLHKGLIRDSGEAEAVLNRLDPSFGIRDPRRSYRSAADCTWLV